MVKYIVLLITYSVALGRIMVTVKNAKVGKFNLNMVVMHFVILVLFLLCSVMSLVAIGTFVKNDELKK